MSSLEIKKDDPDDLVMALDAEADAPNPTIRIVAKDGRGFELPREYTKISELMKNALKLDSTAAEIPVPNVSGGTLELVVSYMEHHKGTEPKLIPKPLRSKIMRRVVEDVWDADFIDRVGENREKLFALILAANYLDIQGLLHLGSAKVASLIKDESLDDYKRILDNNAQV